MEQLLHLDLFSGIGGFALAAQRCGFRTVAFVEKEPFCQRVLAARFPGVPIFDDVRTVSADAIQQLLGGRPLDLQTFGWPCQDHSVAGQQAGLGLGERSGLFREAIRLAGFLRPRWLVAENVPGLFSTWSPCEPPPRAVRVDGAGGRHRLPEPGDTWEVDESSDLESVLAAFRDLGYLGAWRVLDAQWFGVAQRRRRVFFVGHLGAGGGSALQRFLASGNGHPAPRRETREDPAATLDVRAGRSGETSFHTSGGLAASLAKGSGVTSNAPGRRREDDVNLVAGTLGHGRSGGGRTTDLDHVGAYVVEEVSPALRAKPNDPHRADMASYAVAGSLTARYGKSFSVFDAEEGNFIAHTLRASGFDASEDGAGCGTPLVVREVAATLGDRMRGQDDACADNLIPSIIQEAQTGVRVDPNAGTLRADAPGSQPTGSLLLSQQQVRRLTPTEAERLQGFSWRDPESGAWLDGWTCLCGCNHGRSVAPHGSSPCTCPDGPRYSACGNAVAVPNVEWILRGLGAAT